MVKVLFQCLQKESSDTLCRQIALAALQKLSLRRAPQSVMIRSGKCMHIVAFIRPRRRCAGVAAGHSGQARQPQRVHHRGRAVPVHLHA